MLYALICDDKPGSLQVRLDTRPVHLEHLKSLGQTLAFAGPFLNEDGQPTGSLVVVEAASEAEARALGESDPYARAGLFASIAVRRWNWTINNPKG